MNDILGPVAVLFHNVLPGWVILPDLTFALPHSMYWLGLLLFPPLAMYLVKCAERVEERRISAPISYLLWVWGGFAGLHRFYLRSTLVGLVYVVLFVLVLLGNNIAVDARNVSSDFNNQLRIAEHMVARHQKAVDKGRTGAAEKLGSRHRRARHRQAGGRTGTNVVGQGARNLVVGARRKSPT